MFTKKKIIINILALFISVLFFYSCKMNLTNQLFSNCKLKKEIVTMKLEKVVNPEQLSAILKECDYNHFKFFGEEYKYVGYSYSKQSNITTIRTSSSLVIISDFIFLEDYNVCFFEDKVIFIDKLSDHDDNIFQFLPNDTTFELYYNNNKNDNITFCFFDSLYNINESEKFEPIFIK